MGQGLVVPGGRQTVQKMFIVAAFDEVVADFMLNESSVPPFKFTFEIESELPGVSKSSAQIIVPPRQRLLAYVVFRAKVSLSS